MLICFLSSIQKFGAVIGFPFEDCCTVFTPRHPRTKPELWKVEREEAKVDLAPLEDEAFRTLSTIVAGRKS